MQIVHTLFLIASVFIEIPRILASQSKCETLEDLNYPTCDYEHLPIPELIRSCKRIGKDVHRDMFSWMLDEDDEITHEHYAEAAAQCSDMHLDMTMQRIDSVEDVAKEMIHQNRELLDKLIKKMIKEEPERVAKLEDDLKKKDSDLFENTFKEYGGHNNKDVILTELIMMLSEGDSKYFDSLNLDITNIWDAAADDSDDSEDSDDDEEYITDEL